MGTSQDATTRPRPRLLAVAATLAATLVATLCVLAVGTSPAAASDASDLFANTNASRAQYSLGPLQYDPAASAVAQAWSDQLAAAGVLSHNPNLVQMINAQVTPDWTRVGENVGYAQDANVLENAFMSSAPHKANILGDYNRVGVGTTRDGFGRLWAAVVFVNGPSLAPPPPPAPSVSPFGQLDGVFIGPGYVSMQGWAADPETGAPIEIDALVDGGFAGYQTADHYRSDVGAALPAYGPRHGFDFLASMGYGTHQLCVYAINVGYGINTLLGCQTIDVPASPMGQLDALVISGGKVWAEGWSFDPQIKSQIEIDILVDGQLTGWGAADRYRPDVGGVFPLFGSWHGYEAVAAMPRGTHTVCVYGINVGIGINTLLGCKSITY